MSRMSQLPDLTPHPEASTPTGTAWGDNIASERKHQLWARLRAWWAEHHELAEQYGPVIQGPFAGERLTGAEVFWLAVCAALAPSTADAEAFTAVEARLRSSAMDLSRFGRFRPVVALPRLHLECANLSDVDLRGANLLRANLRGANLLRADLRGATLHLAHLGRADLRGARLSDVDLRRAHLAAANLGGADLAEARLNSANLSGADLSGADLTEANLSRANLSDANLSDANLSRANLSVADLSKAKLSWANLSGANLREAYLIEGKLTEANLSEANLSEAMLAGATLTAADLSQAVCVRTDFSGADLTGCTIYGISAWDLDVKDAVQADLRITRESEPAITVDDLQVAQFLYLMLHNENIRQVVDTLAKKLVLLLGRFTPERKVVLDALREELRRRDYVPVLFDVTSPSHLDLIETVSTLAHLARFIIVDLTDAKSVAAELAHIVPNLPSVAIQPLIHVSDTEYAVFGHMKRFPWVLATYRYTSSEHLLSTLSMQVIDPAEQRANELLPPRQ